MFCERSSGLMTTTPTNCKKPYSLHVFFAYLWSVHSCLFSNTFSNSFAWLHHEFSHMFQPHLNDWKALKKQNRGTELLFISFFNIFYVFLLFRCRLSRWAPLSVLYWLIFLTSLCGIGDDTCACIVDDARARGSWTTHARGSWTTHGKWRLRSAHTGRPTHRNVVESGHDTYSKLWWQTTQRSWTPVTVHHT